MQIKRIPTALERWFLDLCAKSHDVCLLNGNNIGVNFWGHIAYLAHEEFYNHR